MPPPVRAKPFIPDERREILLDGLTQCKQCRRFPGNKHTLIPRFYIFIFQRLNWHYHALHRAKGALFPPVLEQCSIERWIAGLNMAGRAPGRPVERAAAGILNSLLAADSRL
jgi:hypothetical protein